MSNYWRKKEVLITGANGFVGSHFVEDLCSMGAKVIGTYLSDRENCKFDGANLLKIDLLDFDELLKQTEAMPIDTIIHCASLDGNAEFKKKNSARIMDENSRMVSNILNFAKIRKVKNVVIMSSAEIYSHKADSPIIEEDDYLKYFEGGENGYVLSKIFSEVLGKLYAEQFKIKVFFPRPTNIYGPRDKFNADSTRVIPSMIYKVLHNQKLEIWGDGKQIRSFIYVKDLVKAILLMVELDKYRTLNIATKETISIVGLAKLIEKIAGKNSKIKLLLDKPVGIRRRVLNNDKFKNLSDFTFIDVRSGIEETLKWYKKVKYE